MAETTDGTPSKWGTRIWNFFLLAALILIGWNSFLVHPSPHSAYSSWAACVFYFLLTALWMGLGVSFLWLDRFTDKQTLILGWLWLFAGCSIWWFVDQSPFSGYPSYIDRAAKMSFFSLTAVCFPLAILLYSAKPERTVSVKRATSPLRFLFLAALVLSGLWLILALLLEGLGLNALVYPTLAVVLSSAFLFFIDRGKAASPATAPSTKNLLIQAGWLLSGIWLAFGILVVVAWTKSEDNIREIRDATLTPWYHFAGWLLVILWAPLALFLFLDRLKKRQNNT